MIKPLTAPVSSHPDRGCRCSGLWPALLLLSLPLTGCVSPAPRVNQAAEMRAASDPAALTRIADAAAASGDVATASSFYGRAAELRPENADAVLKYARALAVQGKLTEAIQALQASLPHLDADRTAATSLMLGKLMILAHRSAEAVSVFREGLARSPENTRLLIGLGVALDADQDFSAAQDAYHRALAVEPDSIAAQNDLALSTALQGDAARATTVLTDLRDRVAKSGGDTASLAMIDGNLALVYAMRGNMKQAETRGAAATSNPGDLAGNVLFYSALAPDAPPNGAADSKGLAGAAPAD